MTINAKQKGKRVELEVAHFLISQGFPSARRTQQYNGGEGLSDLVCEDLAEWHIESKGTKSGHLTRSLLNNWWEQIERDCPDNLTPVIFNKANGKNLIAIMPANHWKNKIGSDPFIEYSFSFGESLDAADSLAYFSKHNELVKLFYTPRLSIPAIVHAIDEAMSKLVVIVDAEAWTKFVKKNLANKESLVATDGLSPL